LSHVCLQTAQFRFAKHAPSKEFSCKMTKKLQADVPPSRQAGFVRCCLDSPEKVKDLLRTSML
ncbi:MAG: hypothetical protein IJ060_00870, partial [Oscillospiraceae bacterium]|nr:hypothetical protein [Oscillospiraceae bacterium]